MQTLRKLPITSPKTPASTRTGGSTITWAAPPGAGVSVGSGHSGDWRESTIAPVAGSIS